MFSISSNGFISWTAQEGNRAIKGRRKSSEWTSLCKWNSFHFHQEQNLARLCPHLPNLFAMTPTLKEPTMPPTLKMATAMLQTMVQTPGLMGCL